MRQPKKERAKCPECGKPDTKFNPLPHDHTPITRPKEER